MTRLAHRHATTQRRVGAALGPRAYLLAGLVFAVLLAALAGVLLVPALEAMGL